MFNKAYNVLGPANRKQPDWFAENIQELQHLIDRKNTALCNMLSRNTRATKSELSSSRSSRQLKNDWLLNNARQIQYYANGKDSRMFYRAINELYGPSSRGVAPILSSDGQTLVTNHEDILKRWLEH